VPDSTSAPGDALPVDIRAGDRPRRRRLASVLVAVAALVGAGTVAWYRLSQPSPIVVAFANSLSGPLAPFGKEALTATRIYLAEVNSRGGIDGHPVQLKLYDDQSSVDRERTGERAGWIGAAAEDAARVTIEALRRAHIHDTPAKRAVDRQKVRAALSAMTDPAKAPVGINGPLYFTAERSMPRPIRFGFFYKDRFISAPLQLVRVENPNPIDAVHETDLGHVVQIGNVLYWVQRVVYTGIDVTHLSDVDVRNGTFQAQFYLWMRYAGTDNLPTNVEFPDLKGSFDPAHPDETGIEDRLNYRLYRVQGTFKDSYDLHDFPFYQQHLLLRLQNRQQPREQIAYVIDTFGLHTRDAGISARQNSAAFRDLQLWHVQAVRPFIEAFSISSTIGKPELFDTANRIEYGAYATDIIVSRNALAFMVKTMIPLFLLTVVVFVTMFFPHTLGKERTTIPVTAILTSAVLLISIGNQLPPLGYTVTLEYVFYVFFALTSKTSTP